MCHITSSAECKEDKIGCIWRESHGWLQLIADEMKLHACMPGPAQLWVAGGGIVEIQQRASQHGRCNSNGTSSLKQIKKIKTDLISNFFCGPIQEPAWGAWEQPQSHRKSPTDNVL